MDYDTDRIDEQSYFWALFKPELPELFEFWQFVANDYDDLEFGDLMNLSMQMEHLCPRKFHGLSIEVFICRRIWQDKVNRDYIIDLDFLKYIYETPALRWLFQPDPRLLADARDFN